MIRLTNYFKVLKDYWHTPKGRHDILDYSFALFIIILISIIIALILMYFIF